MGRKARRAPRRKAAEPKTDPILDDLDIEVERMRVELGRRCDAILRDAKAAAFNLRQNIDIRINAIPSKLRKMTVADFTATYGNLLGVDVDVDVKENKASAASAPGTVLRPKQAKSRGPLAEVPVPSRPPTRARTRASAASFAAPPVPPPRTTRRSTRLSSRPTDIVPATPAHGVRSIDARARLVMTPGVRRQEAIKLELGDGSIIDNIDALNKSALKGSEREAILGQVQEMMAALAAAQAKLVSP